MYDAASQMQQILHENVPKLVVYENMYLQAYRTDKFTGFVQDYVQGISGQWSNRKVHPKVGDIMAGNLTTAIPTDVDTFNHFSANNIASTRILDNLYSSLYRHGPDSTSTPVNDLATNVLVETHEDNFSIPSGHTRHTFSIVHNAFWTDGTPLTAQDVANTFIYLKESAAYGNPAGTGIANLVSATAKDLYTVVVELDTQSYWDFAHLAYAKIIPYHIYSGIAYSSWNNLTRMRCGPFVLTDSSSPTHVISRYALHHHKAVNPAPVIAEVNDISYEAGTTGHEIVWQVSDDNPLLYTVFRNWTVIDTGVWNTTEIRVNIDGLAVGTYNFTLFLFDSSLNVANDTVWVTVTPAAGGGIDSQVLLIIGVGAGIAAAVIVGVVVMRKQT
ncbi:MAG: hypothetical protein DRP09_02040 [Candidatus Thorarchaeota archaeon]|nr:MAG: hypothetical protein DRP09_02040 [Candidatus Thorarchaeota archaeon]